jgi:hypothetical protein
MQLCELPGVDIAILPADARVATPWHNFVIHNVDGGGASYVTSELIHGTQRLGEAEDVQLYRSLWDRLWSASAVDGDAVQLIRRAQAQQNG